MNLTAVNDLRAALRQIDNLLSICRPRGPLCDLPRDRVVAISRSAARLQKLIAEALKECPQLKELVDETAN